MKNSEQVLYRIAAIKYLTASGVCLSIYSPPSVYAYRIVLRGYFVGATIVEILNKKAF